MRADLVMKWAERVRLLESEAVRVTGVCPRRVFEMPDGGMVTLVNEGSSIYTQTVMPIGREEAAEFYDWVPA